MKKLSILAAGVAVLSMCACTEANEFTPSTNNSTKKITEIKVASNASALGTRTVFDTSDDNFGAVKWEEGDKLYFFKNVKNGTNTNSQIFACDAEDDVTYSTEPKNQYDWNSFTAEGTGLDEGEDYYAYYFPEKANNKKEEITYYKQIYVMRHTMYDNGGNVGSPLRQFMEDYDLLMSSNSRESDEMNTNPTLASVYAKENMDAIYMDHAFALVIVDLKCTGMGEYTDYHEIPYYVGAELSAEDENGEDCIDNKYKINSKGELEFCGVGTIMCNYDDRNYYYLTSKVVTPTVPDGINNEKQIQTDNLSFYFLVHTSKSEVKKLNIEIITNARQENASDSYMKIDKGVTIAFANAVNFIPGNCYHFDLNVDYGVENVKKGPFVYSDHWEGVEGQVTLYRYPSEMTPSEVTYSVD